MYGARIDDNLSLGEIAPNSRRWYDNEVVTAHCCETDEGCGYSDRCSQSDCSCECDTCRSMEPEYLDGTSAIKIDDPDDLDAIRAALASYSAGAKQIVILESDRYTYGDDDGEIMMVNARVIAIHEP